MEKFKLKSNKPKEFDEQVLVFQWAKTLEARYPYLWLLNGSLNGTKMNIGQAVKMKRSGMKKGYPDIFLPVARGSKHGLYIELKRKGGKTSVEQLEWLKRLNEQGYEAVVCVGGMEAINKIKDYLEI